tara:strand:- start:950 stop:1177 length:228 start_codon:yes stop_codon:yes gene_type:complete
MTGRNDTGNGWTEHKKLVLHRQEEIEHDVRQMRKRMDKIERQIAIHNAQSRMVTCIVGAIAGLVPVVVAILLGRM